MDFMLYIAVAQSEINWSRLSIFECISEIEPESYYIAKVDINLYVKLI